jgi:hypothetical protein
MEVVVQTQRQVTAVVQYDDGYKGLYMKNNAKSLKSNIAENTKHSI